MGAWIEISVSSSLTQFKPASRPSWARGLKYIFREGEAVKIYVAPLMGAWIEIGEVDADVFLKEVAPLMGAWIEISVSSSLTQFKPASRPSWARGLK